MLKGEREEIIGGDITLKLELGKAPKLARTTSHKVVTRPPQLFSDLPDATSEATRSFQRIPDCIYGAKYLGSTEPALECDCTEEW
ncbi:histone methyltransferase set2, partial [Cryomyces antarcticus]